MKKQIVILLLSLPPLWAGQTPAKKKKPESSITLTPGLDGSYFFSSGGAWATTDHGHWEAVTPKTEEDRALQYKICQQRGHTPTVYHKICQQRGHTPTVYHNQNSLMGGAYLSIPSYPDTSPAVHDETLPGYHHEDQDVWMTCFFCGTRYRLVRTVRMEEENPPTQK